MREAVVELAPPPGIATPLAEPVSERELRAAGDARGTATSSLHSRSETELKPKRGDKVLLVTPNSKLSGAMANAGLVPSATSPDSILRAAVFNECNYALQRYEFGLVWIDVVKLTPQIYANNENRYLNKLDILVANACRRGIPVILAGHYRMAWSHPLMHHLQETHNLTKSEHAWCRHGGVDRKESRSER